MDIDLATRRARNHNRILDRHQNKLHGVDATLAGVLWSHGPLSLRSLTLAVPGRNEGDVVDALERMQARGLVAQQSGGLFAWDKSKAFTLRGEEAARG
jgi:hypothetical protein